MVWIDVERSHHETQMWGWLERYLDPNFASSLAANHRSVALGPDRAGALQDEAGESSSLLRAHVGWPPQTTTSGQLN